MILRQRSSSMISMTAVSMGYQRFGCEGESAVIAVKYVYVTTCHYSGYALYTHDDGPGHRPALDPFADDVKVETERRSSASV